jgi:hypothetical protein
MPNLGDLLSSLVPGGSVAGSPVAPRRGPGQDEDGSTTGSWDQSRGHRSQSGKHDAQDD